jgi:hypothetical protein
MDIDQEETSSSDSIDNEQSDLATNNKKFQASENVSDTNITNEEYINKKKEQLAEIAQLITEDPENNVILQYSSCLKNYKLKDYLS